MHATPGEMKSFRSSADRIALMFVYCDSTATLRCSMFSTIRRTVDIQSPLFTDSSPVLLFKRGAIFLSR